MMDCDGYRQIASARLDGEASRDEVEALERHLAGCEDCRRWVSAVAENRERLLDWPEERPRRPLATVPGSGAWRWLAAAAVLIAALGVGFVTGRASAPTGRVLQGVEETSVPAPRGMPPEREVFMEERMTVYPERNETHSETVLYSANYSGDRARRLP
jgi:predicted anti-sigma-YlaC factor YlaD